MAIIKSTLNAIDKIPQALVRFMDWATDGNKVADTKKELDTAKREAIKARSGRAQANQDVKDRQTDFNNASANLTDKENLLKLSQDYLNNVITHPDIQRLYSAAANATDPLTKRRLSEQLVKRLTPNYVGGKSQYHADPEMDRALFFLDYMYPNVYQQIYSKPGLKFTVDDVYDALYSNAYGSRDFKQFSDRLLNQARAGISKAQAEYDTEKLITHTDPNYINAEKALSKSGADATNADALYRANRGEWNQANIRYKKALANQENKLKNARLLTGMTLGGGTLLGIPAAYYASDISDYLGQAYRDFIGQPKSPNQEAFNDAGIKTLAANSEPLPDPSIQGQSFRLPGMVTANSATPPSAPAPVTREAPASVAPASQKQSVNVAPAPSSDDTYGYLDTALNRPKQPFTPTIQGRRTPSQEAALAKGMFDYRRQSARNALGGLSPAEAVQRGIIPYEALAYV